MTMRPPTNRDADLSRPDSIEQLVAQEVTRVTTRILLEIVLVIVLGTVPACLGDDLRHDRALPLPRRVHARLHTLRDLALLRRRVEDRRAVLRADVVALTVRRCRVVQTEEPLLEQRLVAQHRRIEHDPHRLGVAGFAVVRVVIRRVLEPTTHVADVGIEHAGDATDDFFNAPEAAARDDRDLGLLAGGVRRGGRRGLSDIGAHVSALLCAWSPEEASRPGLGSRPGPVEQLSPCRYSRNRSKTPSSRFFRTLSHVKLRPLIAMYTPGGSACTNESALPR